MSVEPITQIPAEDCFRNTFSRCSLPHRLENWWGGGSEWCSALSEEHVAGGGGGGGVFMSVLLFFNVFFTIEADACRGCRSCCCGDLLLLLIWLWLNPAVIDRCTEWPAPSLFLFKNISVWCCWLSAGGALWVSAVGQERFSSQCSED